MVRGVAWRGAFLAPIFSSRVVRGFGDGPLRASDFAWCFGTLHEAALAGIDFNLRGSLHGKALSENPHCSTGTGT